MTYNYSQNMKYVGIELTKYVENVYTENCKIV